MGQAKQRGTYEERVAQSKAHESALAETFAEMPKEHPVHKHIEKHGTRKTVLVGIMAGLLPSFSQMRKTVDKE